MSGNSIGRLFTVTTFGESHGPALGCIVDGCPPGLESERSGPAGRRRSSPHRHVAVRQPAQGRRRGENPLGRVRRRTTGTPIGILIENTDARSRDYEKIKDRFRPGHADYTYQQKYGFRDYRGGGRSSARETVMRVAAGAIARKYLRERLGVQHQRLPEPDRLARHRPGQSRSGLRQSVLLSRSRARCRSSKTSCGRSAAKAIRSARRSR